MNEKDSNLENYLTVLKTLEDMKASVSPLIQANKNALDKIKAHEEAIKSLMSDSLSKGKTLDKHKVEIELLHEMLGDVKGKLDEHIEHDVLMIEKLDQIDNDRVIDIIERLYPPKSISDEDLEYIESVLTIHPDSGVTMAIKASILDALDRKEEAIQWIDDSIKRFPKEPHLWYKKATILTYKDVDVALEALNNAIEYIDEDDELGKHLNYYSRGYCYLYQLKYEEALEDANKSIEFQPECPSGWILKGDILLQLNKYIEALGTLEKAIELDDENDEAYHLKAKVLIMLGEENYDSALTALNKAISINNNNPYYYFNKGFLLSNMNELNDGLTNIDKGLEINPDEPCAWCKKGLILTKLERNVEALESINKSIKLIEEYNEDGCDTLYIYCAISLIELGENEKAKEMIHNALSINPDNETAQEIMKELEE